MPVYVLSMPPTGPRIGIRELRKAYSLTLEQLADRIAVEGFKRPSADSLANVELGHRRASRELMTAWAKALGLHPLDVEQMYPEVKDKAEAAA